MYGFRSYLGHWYILPLIEFNFCLWLRKCSNLTLYRQLSSFLSITYWRDGWSFRHCISLPLSLQANWPQTYGFVSGLSVLLHWPYVCFRANVMLSWLLYLCHSLKSGKVIPSFSSVLFAQYCFGNSESFLPVIPTNSRIICSSSVKIGHG